MRYARRSSHRRTLAQRARALLMRKSASPTMMPSLHDAWLVALSLDDTCVQFRGNIGFSDGSVLLRGLYQRREGRQYTEYHWTWRALHG